MNEHAGPACALSVLIVGLFAVLLHDRGQIPKIPDPRARPASAATTEMIRPPTSTATAATPTSGREPQAPPLPPSPPRPQSSAEVRETSAVVRRPAPPSPGLDGGPAPATALARAAPSPPEPRPQVDRQARKPRPVAPPATFTVVLPGERLADVAARVYGSADSTERLWRANRDQVTRIDSAVSGGTLLRTP